MSTIINNKEYLINEFKNATDEIQQIKIEFTKIVDNINIQEKEWLISLDKIFNDCSSLYPVLFNIVKEYVGYTYSMDCMYWSGKELNITISNRINDSMSIFWKDTSVLTTTYDEKCKEEYELMRELIELL
jgi:hypothetical protein